MFAGVEVVLRVGALRRRDYRVSWDAGSGAPGLRGSRAKIQTLAASPTIYPHDSLLVPVPVVK